MPKLKQLHQRYKDQGLVLIGVHSDPDALKMEMSVKENALDYLIAQDGEGKLMKALHGDSFPDYYIIDRAGNVRVADLANAELERAIETMIKEKPPTN